jgi:nucleoid-associated protein YgaU
MAIKKKPAKPSARKPAKPSVRKPAKPSVRKPAKPSVRKPAKPPARKTVARKTASVRKSTSSVRSSAVRKPTPASPRPSTPVATPPQSGVMSGLPSQSQSQQPPLGSFYQRVEPPMATHTVKEGETLSEIALRYYGNADEKHYMHIYHANRSTIGVSPSMIKAGQELNIPKPPAE